MPKVRTLPPLDSDKSTLFGPFALVLIGYGIFRLSAEFSRAWVDAMFVGRDHTGKEERTLPVPDPLDDRPEPELFA